MISTFIVSEFFYTAKYPLDMHKAKDLNPKTTPIVHRRIRRGPFVTPNNCQYRTRAVSDCNTEHEKYRGY